jgi:hypothetical protein
MTRPRDRRARERAAAIAEAEKALRADYGEVTRIEAVAIRLAARLVVRIESMQPGDDPIRLSEALQRMAASTRWRGRHRRGGRGDRSWRWPARPA